MTINERVKYFRKNVLHLNQTDFAASVGMKQTSISTLEKPGATVSEQFIKTICSVYSINEDWLRNGNEPIKIESTTFSLDDFAKSHGATSQELEILKVELPDVSRIPAVRFDKAKELVAGKYNRKIRNPFDLEPEEEALIGQYFKEEYNEVLF